MLASPADAARQEYIRREQGYLVKCEHCGKAHGWTPDLGLTDAQCVLCGKTYDAEFGEVMGTRAEGE